MINPYAIIGALILWAASLAGTGWWAYGAGQDHETSKQATAEKIRQQTLDAAQQGAANAISKVQITNTTIRQAVETRIREVPVYRSCQHDQRVLDNLNSSLRGEPALPVNLPGGSGGAQ